jgi:beta-galactosidase
MMHILSLLVCPMLLAQPSLPPGAPGSPNLALQAKAGASESYDDLTPEKAADGKPGTRWSGIPGHNEGVWYELRWEKPVRVAEVIVQQFDRFVMELDIQVLDRPGGQFRTLEHRGRPGARLPKVLVFRLEPVETTCLRIGNITNGPSFTEVEVYSSHFAIALSVKLASDLQGNFVGVVTDPWGSGPCAGARVELAGRAALGDWKLTASANENGLFFAPMPLGLEGSVTARASIEKRAGGAPGPDSPTEHRFDACAFQHGLTPRGAWRSAASLAGKWMFLPDPPEGFWKPDVDDAAWAEISVPSHWEMEGFRARTGVGGYRRKFEPPPGEGRIKLRFEGVYSGAEVWVNGQLVSIHEGGATPFEADISGAVKPGLNVLALRVREHTPTSDELDKMSLYADFPLAGIFRQVRCFRVPAVHIGALAVTTTFDSGYRDAKVLVRAAVLNESPAPFRGTLAMRLAGPLGGPGSKVRPVPLGAPPAPVEVGPWGKAEIRLEGLAKEPRKWDAEHPNLHELALDLRSEGGAAESTPVDARPVETTVERIGFRQTEIRGAEILVNGKPVKLRGTCHHDTHPLLGRAVTPEIIRKDLLLMKEANLNVVRTSHYPPVPELLDIADELGLYVEDEASFCWVGVSNDLSFTPRILQLTAELIARDRNHPSIPFWSLCNESEFGFGFERSHEWVRAADPSRPTSAATSAWLEIATLHNPIAISRMDEHEGLDKPLLFDESLCIYQGIFNDVAEMWVDPGIRDYYVEPLRAVYARFMKSRSTQGSMIWCWADDIFCVPGRGLEYGRGATRSHFLEPSYRIPGRGLTGDAPWGVVDGWRRLKPEYWITKKLHSPVKIAEGPLPLPGPGEPIRVRVENQYDFTDISELKISWALGGEKGTAEASIPPRSQGTLSIPVAAAPREGDVLALEFRGASGLLIDAYRLPLGREEIPAPVFEPCRPGGLQVLEEDLLAGSGIRVVGEDFELAFDRGSGLLRRGVGKGEAVLLELPALHVLPTRDAQSPLPARRSWKLEKLAVQKEGDDVRVTLEGAYEGFRGRYDYVIHPDGDIEAAASFEYTGEDLKARELGLRFSVPRESAVLRWARKAEWSVYPADHIGRPLGTAIAFSDRPQRVPPERPWSEDPSPMGSNDFRSTKRNIHWAAVHSPLGPGIVVEPSGQSKEGLQHLRAFVETDRISVHVNDHYGGTGVGWWEWVHNYGDGKLIKKGEVIRSKVRLRIAGFERPREDSRDSSPQSTRESPREAK